GADDAGGDRLLEPERAVDGDRRLTDLDLHPEREAGDVEPAAGGDLHHGDVAGAVAADHVTLLHGAVGETHADGLARVADYVRGGEDVALVAVDHAGAEAGVRLDLHHRRAHRGGDRGDGFLLRGAGVDLRLATRDRCGVRRLRR